MDGQTRTAVGGWEEETARKWPGRGLGLGLMMAVSD